VSPATAAAVLATARRTLTAAGIDSAAIDARLLATHALGCDMAALIGHPERGVDAAVAARLDELVARRARREPLAYILGRREFWSLSLQVTPATLIPRPDSETVVEAALCRVVRRRTQALRVLDLGTGSGCLLAALLVELPNAWGVGVDLSAAALTVARANLRSAGVSRRAALLRADWTAALAGCFDLIVANPPYITNAEWTTLSPEVRDHEPATALRGGVDGADAYRALLPDIGRLLAADGAACVELGRASAAAALRAGRAAGLQAIDLTDDLGGRPRCVTFVRMPLRKRKKNLGNQPVPV
jgi:release factor glutamine methyltransferase